MPFADSVQQWNVYTDATKYSCLCTKRTKNMVSKLHSPHFLNTTPIHILRKTNTPYSQAVGGRVGQFGPGVRDIVEEQGCLQLLHLRGDRQFTLRQTYLTIISLWIHTAALYANIQIRTEVKAHLESQVKLLEWAPYLTDEHVHALALLEAHQDVGGPFSCLRGDVRHVILLWKLLQHLI